VLALFRGTRGLFTGWLKGVVLLALAPLFAVLGGSLMLELAVPVLSALVATPGKIDPQAAMAFFMIGAVHAALMILVMKVAGTMVSGWTVFGLAGKTWPERGEPAPAAAIPLFATPAAGAAADQARASGQVRGRRIGLAPFAPSAANDPGALAAGRTMRIAGGGGSEGAPDSNASQSRARGVGSRFRAAPARASLRRLEKMP
jgi:type IV secretion system protein VirB6